MKLKALLLALFTAGFAVSIAVAATPAAIDHKGKPTTSTSTDGSTTSASHEKGDRKGRSEKGDRRSEKGKRHAEDSACKRGKKILVIGTFVAAGPTTGDTAGFAMLVTGGNRAAKALKGKQATVLVDDSTKFKGKKHALADLVAGDRLLVQGRACKADLAAGSLLARKVMSKRPKGAEEGGGSTTTTTPPRRRPPPPSPRRRRHRSRPSQDRICPRGAARRPRSFAGRPSIGSKSRPVSCR